MILRSYARHISTEAPSSAIIEDVKRRNGRPMDPKTFGEYVDVLRDLYVIEEVRAWTPSIRSKTPIRTSPTRHLTDPSIACCALSIKPDDLINDLNLFGMLFEELAVRDLTVYASTMGGEVLHYRDNTGLECDAVVRLPDGRWGAVAVRLGGDTAVKEAASSLKTLQRKLMEKSNELPSAFLMVLTAVGAASLRPDGVCVVPITMLRP